MRDSIFKLSQMHPLATPRGASGTRPRGVQILSFSCSFRQKNLENNSTFGSWRTLLRKILDPPLSCFSDLLDSPEFTEFNENSAPFRRNSTEDVYGTITLTAMLVVNPTTPHFDATYVGIPITGRKPIDNG